MSEEFENFEDEEFDGMIELVDENGETQVFELLGAFPNDEPQYLAVTEPSEEEDPESIEVYFLKIEQDEEGNDVYTPVEDDQVDAIYEMFLQAIDDGGEEE